VLLEGDLETDALKCHTSKNSWDPVLAAAVPRSAAEESQSGSVVAPDSCSLPC